MIAKRVAKLADERVFTRVIRLRRRDGLVDYERPRQRPGIRTSRHTCRRRLVVWEGLSHAEAAEVMGCSINAIALRMRRAKQRLRRVLAPNGSASGDYRDGSLCHLVDRLTSMCSAEGRVFPPVKTVAPTVPRGRVATTVSAQVVPARSRLLAVLQPRVGALLQPQVVHF